MENTASKDWETSALRLLALMLLVMFTAWLGIATRPVGMQASFWPANAVLLGLFILYPRLATPASWVAALVGLVLADLVMEGDFLVSLRLSLVNLTFVACGLLLVRIAPARWRTLRRPAGLLTLFGVCLLASVCSALAAILLGRMLGPPVFATAWDAASSWFGADLVNAVLILPVMLSAPEFFSRRASGRHSRRREDIWEFAPVVALLVSLMVCAGLGGPGSLGFVVPALLWCALSYSLFMSALLILLTCIWLVAVVSLGLLPLLDADTDAARTLSLHLGITLFALGPLAVASITQARDRQLKALRRRADHDILTGALTRRGFFGRGEALLGQWAGSREPLVVMMLDLDHFKRVNDCHGHAVGDGVLRAFSTTVKRSLRQNDLFGRLGGEEFALVLKGLAEKDALALAERIRSEVTRRSFKQPDGVSVPVTLSIGLAWFSECPAEPLEQLLAEADRALYQAKEAGRDRVVAVTRAGQEASGLSGLPLG